MAEGVSQGYAAGMFRRGSLCGLIAAGVLLVAPVHAADDWQAMSFISGTLGNNAGRLCTGAPGTNRPSDLGCPNYAPYVSNSGNVGIGTANPNAKLEAVGLISSTGASVTGIVTATFYEGDGSRLINLPAGADNMGDHTASRDVLMGAYNISGTGYVSATAFYSGDGAAYFYNNFVIPSLVFDTNDYLRYTRATNIFDVLIGGTSYARVTAGGISTTTLYADVVTATTANVGSLTASGIVTASFFEGDGSRLTGLSATGDRITSGTLTMLAISETGYISMTTGAANWGYLSAAWSYLPKVFSGSVSSTNVSMTVANLTPRIVTSVVGSGGNAIASGTTNVTTTSDGSITLVTNNTQRMVVDNGGQVGIGTATPNALLDVAGLVSTSSLTVNGVAITGGASSQWTTNGDDIYYSTGDVVIGASTPFSAEKLTLYANANAPLYAFFRNDNSGAAAYSGLYLNAYGNSWAMRMGSTAANSNKFHITSDILGTPADRITIDTGGNVGIGTTSPDKLLEVESVGTGNDEILIQAKASGATGFPAINIDRASGVRSALYGITTAGTANWRMGVPYNGGAATTQFMIGTGMGLTDAKLLIDSSGNVGIGTTGPGSKLESYIATAASATDWEKRNISAAQGINTANRVYTGYDMLDGTYRAAAVGYGYDGTGYFMALGTNDNTSGDPIERVRIDRSGNVGIGTTGPSTKLFVTGSDADYTTTVQNTRGDATGNGLYVQTRWNVASNYIARFATNSGAIDVMAIKGDGNVGIGTTSPGALLDVAGNLTASGASIRFPGIAVAGGYYVCINNASGWQLQVSNGSCTHSDMRLKKNIASLDSEDGLSLLQALRPVSFNWKDETIDARKQFGLIAQEVEQKAPDLVSTDANGIKRVNYEGLIAPLVKAVQELKAANDELRAIMEAQGREFRAYKVAHP